MEWIWLSAGEGAAWRRMDIEDWMHDGTRWVAGVTLYADDSAMLAALAAIRDRCAPRAWLYVGPVPQTWGYQWPDRAPWERPDGTTCDVGSMRRYGDCNGWCGDRRASIAVGLCGTLPVQTMHHEVLHHCWRRLTWEERATLEEYGDHLRAMGTPPDVRNPGWWMEAEEAEARSYEMWACGLPQPHRAEVPPEVEMVWRQVAAGYVGRR